MKGIYNNILASCLIGIILFSGCSVTKHLPEGEVLYTGGKTVVENKSATPVGETALTEIDAALDKTPSTKMLGGLLPIPFKMWMYNDFGIWKVDVQPPGCQSSGVYLYCQSGGSYQDGYKLTP